MTLQNGLALKDRALLWSDTAYIEPGSGEVVWFAEKVFQSTLFPAAVSMTTVGASPHLIPEFAGQRMILAFSPLGDFLAACEDALRHYVSHQPEISSGRLLVAGWCRETDSPRLFAIASDGGTWGRPYEAVEVDSYVSSGNRSAAYQLGLAVGFTPERMLALAEAQRAERFEAATGGFGQHHSIGGNLVEYEIDRRGVRSRVVREWGDAVGERIEPVRAAGLTPGRKQEVDCVPHVG